MLDTIISVVDSVSGVVSTAKKSYDAYKQVCAIWRGDKRADSLERIATHIERLSDHILYASNLHAVADTERTQQCYVNNLREVRAALDPVQRAVGSDILSSAMILTPEKMQQALAANPWDVLLDVRPLALFSARLPPEGVPVLFEHDGIRYLGWQLRGTLPILFNCRYDEPWLSTSAPIFSPPSREAPSPDVPFSRMIRRLFPQKTVISPSREAGKTVVGQPFDFEIVTVDAYGQIVRRERKQAQQIIENLGNGVMLEMVYIPGGTFLMGAPKDEKESRDSERPQHRVTIAPFYMGKYPITQAQYRAMMGDNPSCFKGDQRPVERVTWQDAVAFCHKLSQRTGKTYQLPSEAQWEYACRAGTTTPFYFGETITPDLVNYDGNYPYANAPKGQYRQETTPVGSFPPNAFGLYDMHGNVWEWCQDVWHDNYAGAPTDGGAWMSDDDQNWHVLRGGSWYNSSRLCRSADRDRNNDQRSSSGFRVVVLR